MLTSLYTWDQILWMIMLYVLGELIGIEYIFNQTGKAFQVEKPADPEEEEEEIQDEGFEDLEDFEDPTINVAQPILSPGKSPPPQKSSAQMTMEKNRPSRNCKLSYLYGG